MHVFVLQTAEAIEARAQKVDEALEAAKSERSANAKKNADLLAKQKVWVLAAHVSWLSYTVPVLCCAMPAVCCPVLCRASPVVCLSCRAVPAVCSAVPFVCCSVPLVCCAVLCCCLLLSMP